MQRLTASEISQRRVIDRIDLSKGKGLIQANGQTFNIVFEDLLDLTQAVEMILLKLTGKVLNPQFRPRIKSRNGLGLAKLVAGDLGRCETDIPAGVGAKHWYLLVEIDGNRWDNWFTRLDELIKMLYIVVREAQGDEYKPAPSILVPAMGSA